MSLLSEIIEFNRAFVEDKKYEPFIASKLPSKRMVVISCMDARLIELLPAAMDLKNGDVKFLKTAGAVVSHPFGSVMRSVLISVYELEADEVFIIGHYDCGMSSVNPTLVKQKVLQRGVKEETIKTLEASGIDIERWLKGFDSVGESVRNSVRIVRNHPLLPRIPVHGLIIDPKTGRLDVVEEGYDS